MTEQQHPIHAVGSLVRHKNLPDNTLAFVIKHSGESGLGNGGIIVRALKQYLSGGNLFLRLDIHLTRNGLH